MQSMPTEIGREGYISLDRRSMREENTCLRDTRSALRTALALACQCQVKRCAESARFEQKGNCPHRRRGRISPAVERPSDHPSIHQPLRFFSPLCLSVLPSPLATICILPSSAFHLNANGVVISRFDIRLFIQDYYRERRESIFYVFLRNSSRRYGDLKEQRGREGENLPVPSRIRNIVSRLLLVAAVACPARSRGGGLSRIL